MLWATTVVWAHCLTYPNSVPMVLRTLWRVLCCRALAKVILRSVQIERLTYWTTNGDQSTAMVARGPSSLGVLRSSVVPLAIVLSQVSNAHREHRFSYVDRCLTVRNKSLACPDVSSRCEIEPCRKRREAFIVLCSTKKCAQAKVNHSANHSVTFVFIYI